MTVKGYMRLWVGMAAVVMMAGCENISKYDKPDISLEGNNRGVLKVVADKSLESIMNQHIMIFENKFPDADIEISYLDESDAAKQMYDTANSVAIIERRLTQAEFKSLEAAHNLKPKEHIMAKDALVLITAKGTADTLIDIEGLKNLFATGARPLVFEGKSSGAAAYVMNELNVKNSKNVYALKDVDEVIEYVQEHKGAIGFIPYSVISDEQNETMMNRLAKISTMYFKVKKDGETLAIGATQSTIATGDYPLIRPINYVLIGYKGELGIGFVNYLFKQKSSRVFLKEGLVPTVFAERLISIDTGNLEK